MNIYDKKELKCLIEDHLAKGLITVKQSISYPDLRVVKYARRCFYDNIWNDFLKECRGLVIDKDYNVIVHPLTKIFNYGENGWYPNINLDDEVIAFRKFNGFLGCVTNSLKYGLIYSTTGSLDSIYVQYFKEMIQTSFKDGLREFEEELKQYGYDITFCFEVIHPNDPHIIKENLGIHLLAIREDGKIYPQYSDVDDYKPTTLRKLFSSSKQIEGWVCYTNEGEAFKIKTPYYIRQKFFARANINKLENVLKHGSTVNENYLSNFDEDLYEIVDIVKQNKEEFMQLNEQERLLFVDNALKTIYF